MSKKKTTESEVVVKAVSPHEDLNKETLRAAMSGELDLVAYNRRGRGRSVAEKRESYRRYNENKKRVIELEENNHKYLILWPASDVDVNEETKFYNMGGNSAIIYVHEIGPRLKRKPTLRIDMDNGAGVTKFHSGVCSIADVDALTTKLAEIGIRRAASKRPGLEDIIFFRLNREYPQSEIREMLKQEQKRLDNLNKILYANVLFPDIHRQILDLKRIIPSKVKNMDSTYRSIVGVKMIDTLMDVVETYSQMTHGDIDVFDGGKRLNMKLDMILAEVSMMSELKLWDVSACMRVGEITVGAKKLIKANIINKQEEENASD
ncbi:hypothetical protein IJ117_00680 [Candidatus Saccharibacteria bacterium]|nr:hypothetical protein [Candidatus Saccharibacteria bacterium]